ncbi:MAG: hypothetical protein AAFQ02_09250 [Bacteroidota bacterium]
MRDFPIAIQAGAEAYEHIQSHGLRAEDISVIASAAGGPKWFSVYGLTRFIIGSFLASTAQRIHCIGGSVGSWQMTAACSPDPEQAIDLLREAYATYHLDGEGTPEKMVTACRYFIDQVLAENQEDILHHPTRTLHIITSRGKGWLSSSVKSKQVVGFMYSYLLNAISRSGITATADRVIFSSSSELPYAAEQDRLPTRQVVLSKENLKDALQASGTIPFMAPGVYDIPGAETGGYWDGGLTDYHMSFPYDVDGLVIHPHFYPYVLERWYDKKVPYRSGASHQYMSKVILIYPSASWVNSLPKGQISQMKDFHEFGDDQDGRTAYWMEISERSLELGQALEQCLADGRIAEITKPYSRKRRY